MGDKRSRIEATQGKQLSCFAHSILQQNRCESERQGEYRRKAVRHNGGTGFRHAVDSLFCSPDFPQQLRLWLDERYVLDLF